MKQLKSFDRAVKLDTQLSDAHEELGAIYYKNLKDKTKAIYHYEKLLSMKPNHPDREKIQDIINMLKGK